MQQEHLDRERLARLAEGDRRGLDGAQWRHLAGCTACRATLLEATEILHRWHAAPGAMPAPPSLLVAGDAIAREAGARAGVRARLPRRWQTLGVSLGGLAMAASLVAALLLPPRPTELPAASRGASGLGFQRPGEGELVSARRSLLVWTSVSQATLYRLQLRDGEGNSVWEATTTGTSIRLPEALRLEPGASYRAILSVQPIDLLQPGGLSVSFRAGGPWARALQHAHRPQRSAQLLALGGFALLSISLLKRGPRSS